MKKITNPNNINTIPVQIPRKRIYSRLGYNIHMTNVSSEQKILIDNEITTAFSYCEAKGMWLRIPITSKNDDSVELLSGEIIYSKSLSKMLKNSKNILFMAATVGEEIVKKTNQKMKNKEAAIAVIYDAVGSETADASLEWINEYIRQNIKRNNEKLTKHRFSPGYGDLGLENQKIIYNLLKLQNIGITLNDRYMMLPEKSVIGIAGIEEINNEEQINNE